MKLFFSELKANYNKYHFPYQVWLLKEKDDEVENIYKNGFLPIRSIPDVYYLTRSLRVDLAKFELSSENRRIIKKTDNFDFDLVSLSDFKYNPKIQIFCKNYMVKKFGEKSISAAGIKGIFQRGIYNNVFIWKERTTQKQIGYAVCYISGELLQYAHAFYDLEFFQQSLGARMMLEAVDWSRKSGKKYIYLGTCYEENALYKTEFKGVEFFNGFRWSENLEELKELIQRIGKEEVKGKAESSRTKEEYLLKDEIFLGKFYQGDLKSILNNYGIRVKF